MRAFESFTPARTKRPSSHENGLSWYQRRKAESLPHVSVEKCGFAYPFFSIFAQESLSVTVRLNTGCSGVPSGSAQK